MERWWSICLFLLLKEIGLKSIYKKPHTDPNIPNYHLRATPRLPVGQGKDRQEELSLALLCLTQGKKAPWHTKGLILLIVTLSHIHQLQRNPSLFILMQIKTSLQIVCADFQLQTFACGINKWLSLKLYTKDSRFHIPPFSSRAQCPQQNTIWSKEMEVWHSWPYLCCAGLESFMFVS